MVHLVDGSKQCIERIPVGARVKTNSSIATNGSQELVTLNRLHLRLVDLGGHVLEAELLRDDEWVAENVFSIQADGESVAVGIITTVAVAAERGLRCRIEIEEMSLAGEAEVLAINQISAPLDLSGVVTGVFRRSPTDICRVRITGEPEALGVTPSHPLWSVSRDAWISAIQLEPSELVDTLAGVASVISVQAAEPEPVYNIEVHDDHCYRVAEQGVLVHNASNDECAKHNVVDFGPAGAHYDVTPVNVGGRQYNQPNLVVARLRIQSDGSLPSPGATNFVQNIIGFKRSAQHNGPTDEVGHLIGKQFGGKAALASTIVAGNGNFIPQDPDDNDAFQKIEEAIARILKNDPCADICIKITVSYDAAAAGAITPIRPYRPWEVRYQWWQSGQAKGNRIFYNGW